MRGSFWQAGGNGRVLCELCPQGCDIPGGKPGLCGARVNQDGELAAMSYGKITAIALDPIEKKPLRQFFPGSSILSVGSYGCNFRCGFCQNHHISIEIAPTKDYAPQDIAAASEELVGSGNIGVAYTYNEPLVGYEFVRDCAALIKAQGQKNVLVTNGFICESPLLALLPLIDAMNIDLKSFERDFYNRIGGELEPVMRTIETAAAHCHVEVTTLIIPGHNDSPDEMERLSAWLCSVDKKIPLHITRFYPRYKMAHLAPTPVETIAKLAEVARENLQAVYAGNC